MHRPLPKKICIPRCASSVSAAWSPALKRSHADPPESRVVSYAAIASAGRPALAKARATAEDDDAARLYEHAIHLYNGEYLQNLYYDWLFPERRRLTQAYLDALRAMADHHFAHKRYTRSLELLERALRVDNLQEDLHCQALRVYAALGDRAGLMGQYQEMSRVLAEELGLEPLESTARLYLGLINRLGK